MAATFAQKFEEALREAREAKPGFGLRTLARQMAKDDPKQTEIIRRRLNKYRPKPGGGAAEVTPTEPTRREIERELGLVMDSLKPDPVPVDSAQGDREIAALVAALFERVNRRETEAVRDSGAVAA